ncbi:hypothetical protein RvY_15767-1 [Ramazzottius varieornatus]|uniref:Uncharacterized protein n=1 Tax=Ramazzottius varieornatus TaxID=947166 RepID=A0A1D1VW29_RAMVA|nr:hypothetical protein RvY_15767-1 [Ramazzottius varieornatus]
MDVRLKYKQKLDVLSNVVQELTDRKYQPASYEKVPIFETGDQVLASMDGFSYNSTIVEVNEDTCPDYHKLLPCYKIAFHEWKRTPARSHWAIEYDLVGLEHNFHPVQHLLAHYYNEELRKTRKPSDTKLRGLFRLDQEAIDRLEQETLYDTMDIVPEAKNWTIKDFLENHLPP